MLKAYRLVQINADRLFAGFALLAALLLTKSGNYADKNGDENNIYLTASGVIELVANVGLLIRGDRGRPLFGPLFVLGGVTMLASGTGFFGYASGSAAETVTGALIVAASSSIFYGDRFFPEKWVSGGLIGGWLYNLSCVPLLIAGIQHANPFEWSAALAYIAGNLAMASKPKVI